MLKKSYGSVQVTWLDRDAVLESTRQAVAALAAHRPEIDQVILFGSMARGDAVPGSDVDLLMVLESSDRAFLERISLYRPSGIPVGVDVFPYTRQELANMLDEGNGFVRQAQEEGITLYQRPSPGRPG